jgi:hypothetical protein
MMGRSCANDSDVGEERASATGLKENDDEAGDDA